MALQKIGYEGVLMFELAAAAEPARRPRARRSAPASGSSG